MCLCVDLVHVCLKFFFSTGIDCVCMRMSGCVGDWLFECVDMSERVHVRVE